VLAQRVEQADPWLELEDVVPAVDGQDDRDLGRPADRDRRGGDGRVDIHGALLTRLRTDRPSAGRGRHRMDVGYVGSN
jgi:hypothetical protein